VHLAQQHVERIVALKAGLKVFDGPANALDFENIYKLADAKPAAADPAPQALAMAAVR
jgi:ABC-type phosphate/phosphonate transport system ATPase subunit